MTIEKKLELIVPGKTYPSEVEIIEKDGNKVRFLLESYCVGMYYAIYFNEKTIPAQNADHNSKSFVKKLKRDIAEALKRSAIVSIGEIRAVKV